MKPVDDSNPLAIYLGVLRRRWPLVVVAALVAAAALSWLGRPTGETTYLAEHRLIVNPNRTVGFGYSVDQLAVIAVEGDNRQAVADQFDGQIPCAPSASSNLQLGTLSFQARGTNPESCKAVADAFAAQLQASLEGADEGALREQVDDARLQVTEATDALDAAQQALDAAPLDARLVAERDAALSRYQLALENSASFDGVVLPEAPFRSISAATVREDAPEGLAGMHVVARAGAGFGLGAIVGFLIALALDALDRRLRDAQTTAEAFGVPVVGEVPKHRSASGDALAPADSVVMEAYRRVRTVVQLAGALTSGDEHPNGNGAARAGRVVMVASAGPKEGKTTTVAHLAATLAESDHRVLVVGADFRRPRIDRVLGTPPDDGDQTGPWLIGPSSVSSVDIVVARQRSKEPSKFLRDVERMLDVARRSYDVILVDTAPVLVANDALELAPRVDDVLLVARSRSTTVGGAERAAELLRQVDAPLLGAVLTQVTSAETYAYYGYRYGGYGDAAKGASRDKSQREVATPG